MFRLFMGFCAVGLVAFSAAPLYAESATSNSFPAAFAEGPSTVEAQLIAETPVLTPGKPVTVALYLKIAPGWHTYWQNPGDSGLPTTLKWALPAGWSAAPLQWPLPKKHVEEGGLVTYGYEGEVILLTELTPPADFAEPNVTLTAQVSWLACEKTCMPGGAELSLTFPASANPVSSEAQPAQKTPLVSNISEFFQRARAALPHTSPPPFRLTWKPGDTEMRLKVKGLAAGVRAEFFPLTPRSSHPEVTAEGTIRIPTGEKTSEEKSAGVSGLFLLTHPDGQTEGWLVKSTPSRARNSATSGSSAGSGVPGISGALNALGVSTSTTASSAGAPQLSLPKALGFGFLGGLILNLMPCVLPVIALKIFGFLKQAGESREKVFRTGLAYVGGIFAWFLGLAVVMILLRQAGNQVNWSFQFQNPACVLGMMLVVFVFALNLLGVFEIWTPGMGKLTALSERDGYGGTFLHGVFTTLLATPCSAPFLGSALAFAFTQSAPVLLAMFAAIAAGMGFPYLLLSANPGWMRWLPKPGFWMVRLKQIFGFVMLGTVVWLLGVFSSQRGVAGAMGALWLLLALGGACWIFGTWVTPNAARGHRYLAVGAMAGLVGLGVHLAGLQQAPVSAAEQEWQAWSPELVEQLQKEGKPVFVDFTADWCFNCKYNERMVLNTEAVRQAMAAAGVALLKADYTRQDPRITAELKKLKRGAVPVYALHPAGGGEPTVLPELLTQATVVEAVKKLQKP